MGVSLSSKLLSLRHKAAIRVAARMYCQNAKFQSAVYFRNSSNGILPSPRGARLGCGEAKCAAPPRTLKTAKEPENKSARTIFCNGKRNFFHLIKNWLENSLK